MPSIITYIKQGDLPAGRGPGNWLNLLRQPVHIGTTLPRTQLTTQIDGERYQLQVRLARYESEEPWHFDQIYEIHRLGHQHYPLTVGWLAFTHTDDNPAQQPGWFILSRRHNVWSWSEPVSNDELHVWEQDLWSAVAEIVEDVGTPS